MESFNLQKFLPAWNAFLNGTAFFLLVLGLVLIKRKQNLAHKRCMLAAFGVSAVFLSSYLYYHFNYTSQPFQGVGFIRPVYFTMLISHIILAVLILPFIFRLLFLGFKNRNLEHQKLGRWVWPVWAYISLTGVLIYFCLYQWFPGGSA